MPPDTLPPLLAAVPPPPAVPLPDDPLADPLAQRLREAAARQKDSRIAGWVEKLLRGDQAEQKAGGTGPRGEK